MINNFKCCCISSNDRLRYSVRVTNFTNLRVKFILKYTIYDGTALKETYVLKDECKRFYFQREATDVTLNIFDCSLSTPQLIYHECITEKINLCFMISGTLQRIVCERRIC
ncbi:hypothetical protein G8S21_08780 [Clostridium botulinum C]|uniref:hypothetical protein n=1 Tax=Clostridium botulinum TaxID=1491 RepID=UPI001E63D6A6|nr:hypothetical protein [Clostridium botulinum]MCD3246030.1 hypothetical protein [Clostridium botulinum C]MCD3262528.1 hypothetical protein [Clostridium botulinum C]